jgi:hypothetical protein
MQHAAQRDVFIDRIACHATSDSRWVVRVPGVEIAVEKRQSSGRHHFNIPPISSWWTALVHAILPGDETGHRHRPSF